MRLLFIGDVVGRAGRTAIADHLPSLRARWSLDFVIVNGENAAGGFGITETICDDFLDAGADCVTPGNHAWDQREALVFIQRQPRLIRPANYPPGTPGRGASLIEGKNGARVLVMNAMGRVFMDPLDDPFAAVERELDACPLGMAATPWSSTFTPKHSSEKCAMGHFADGRASLSSARTPMSPPPTRRSCPAAPPSSDDAGMTGDYDFVIGMNKAEPLQRFTRRISSGRFEPPTGRPRYAASPWRSAATDWRP